MTTESTTLGQRIAQIRDRADAVLNRLAYDKPTDTQSVTKAQSRIKNAAIALTALLDHGVSSNDTGLVTALSHSVTRAIGDIQQSNPELLQGLENLPHFGERVLASLDAYLRT
jgi:hypothetical protein